MHHLMGRGVRTAMAVITEPFGADNIATIHSGIVHFAVHVVGRSGHISRRNLSEPPYIPDLCTVVVDVHFVPGQTVDGVIADVRAELDAIRAGDPDFEYRIELPPTRIDQRPPPFGDGPG